jgi:hypothetical protein
MAHEEEGGIRAMKKQQFKRWQVILGVIGFLAIYGLVGTLERQGEVTEATSIRIAEVSK